MICGQCVVDGPSDVTFLPGSVSETGVLEVAGNLHCFCCKRRLQPGGGDTVALQVVEKKGRGVEEGEGKL